MCCQHFSALAVALRDSARIIQWGVWPCLGWHGGRPLSMHSSLFVHRTPCACWTHCVLRPSTVWNSSTHIRSLVQFDMKLPLQGFALCSLQVWLPATYGMGGLVLVFVHVTKHGRSHSAGLPVTSLSPEPHCRRPPPPITLFAC